MTTPRQTRGRGKLRRSKQPRTPTAALIKQAADQIDKAIQELELVESEPGQDIDVPMTFALGNLRGARAAVCHLRNRLADQKAEK